MPEFIKKMSKKAKTIAVTALSAALILSVSLGIFYQSGSDKVEVSGKTESSLSAASSSFNTEETESDSAFSAAASTSATEVAEQSTEITTTASTTAQAYNSNAVISDDGAVQTATIAEGNSYVASSVQTQVINSIEADNGSTLFDAGYNLTENMLSNMTDGEKEVLFSILNAAENHETQVEVKNGVIKNSDTKTLSDIFFLVKIALAKTDMISPTYVYSGGEYVTSIKLTYRLTKNETAAQKAQLKSKVKKIMASVTEDMDDYDKLLYFHDEIVSFCSYNTQSENSRSAYGCLVEGKASCEGYSKALLELCDEAGIDCIIAAGTAVSNSQTANHMWNKVRVSGRWYNVDLCWDDVPESSGYDYFLVTDKEISVNHTESQNKFYELPSAVFETDNYFVKNGLFVKSENEILSTVLKSVESAVESGSRLASLKFKNKKLFETANELISESNTQNPIFEILKSVSEDLSAGIDTSSVNKAANEDVLTITFEINYIDETLVG